MPEARGDHGTTGPHFSVTTGFGRRVRRFVAELRRRNVIRTGAWYVGVALAALNGAGHMKDAQLITGEAHRTLTFLLALGLPLTVLLTWVFEISPKGLQRTEAISKEELERQRRMGSPPRWGNPATWIRPALATAALLTIGFLTAVRYDIGGLEGWVHDTAPTLASLPLVGSGAPVPAELVYPTAGGGADPGGSITVVFTDPLDPTSADRENLRLVDPGSGPIPAGIRLLPDRRKVQIIPDDSLAPGTTYGVVLGEDLRGARGERVDADTGPGRVWRRFETRPPPPDREPPALAETRPARGRTDFPPDSSLNLVFDEPVGVGTVSEESVRLLGPGGASTEVTVRCCSDLRKALVRPTSELDASTRYALHLSSEIRDTAGNALRPDTVVFRTGRPRTGRRASGDDRTSSPEAPSPGTFDLDVKPETARSHVRIVVDDQELGRPPVTGHQVTARREHRVEVVGHPPQTPRTVSLYEGSHAVAPGQREEVVPEVPAFGTLTVVSQPPGRVLLDGDYIAETPLAGYPVTAGTHRLEVRPPRDRQDELTAVERTITVEPWTWGVPVRMELAAGE